jgi:hypothetical protein
VRKERLQDGISVPQSETGSWALDRAQIPHWSRGDIRYVLRPTQ